MQIALGYFRNQKHDGSGERIFSEHILIKMVLGANIINNTCLASNLNLEELLDLICLETRMYKHFKT